MNTITDQAVCQAVLKPTLTASRYAFFFSAASSCRTFAIVPCEKSTRFLLFWRRFGLLE
jgi:hypothetical protein